jgi:hypothetical protein
VHGIATSAGIARARIAANFAAARAARRGSDQADSTQRSGYTVPGAAP